MSKVLIIGGGGREHALAWKFARSPQVDRVYVAPGNSGMEDIAERVNIPPTDFKALAEFAKQECISLTVVGPEVPLTNGIVDFFEAEGLPIFGPRANAAIIEGKKSFAKELMAKYKIPTARYKVFTDYDPARAYIETQNPPYVIKADGLAEGKGVIIAESLEEADQALVEMLKNERFGEAGKTIVIEEFLIGMEFSLMAFVNGKNVYPMVTARDYKRAYDGDEGPNTGGMGAYAPVTQIDDDTLTASINEILIPTAEAMVKMKRPFTGILYAGLIATENGPKVIEFNARFGDPETEVVLPLLESDIYTIMTDILAGKTPALTWGKGNTIGVVLASKGYPDKYKTGFPINGLENLGEEILLFHSGTKRDQQGYITNGGRVLFVAKKAESLYAARGELYKAIEQIKCENLFYRKDIGRLDT